MKHLVLSLVFAMWLWTLDHFELPYGVVLAQIERRRMFENPVSL